MRAAHRMAYAAVLIALLTLALPWLNAGSPDGASVAAAGGSPVPRSVEPVEPGPTPFNAETTVVKPPGDDWSDGGSTAQPSSNEGDRKGPKPEPTPTADPTPAPTADPTPAPTPDLTDPSDGVPSAPGELLISAKRLQDLPTSGSAWDYLVKVAHADWPAPELDDQDSRVNVMALAAALVYARTGETAMATRVRDAIAAMIPTYDLSEDAGLGPARQLAGWVMAADLVGLEGPLDGAFRDLLGRALSQPIGSHARWGASLAACHEDADNNWGAWCGAARIAAARYLGDTTELERAWRVYRGFLGDRDAWSGFRGQGAENAALSDAIRSWACDGSAAGYVPTNPRCGDRSGAFPADISRDDATYDRIGERGRMYQSETTAGLVLQAELLHRAGYPSWTAVGGALARVAAFDVGHGAWNLGTVQYHWPWLINRRLGTSYPTVAANYGRSLGFTDWLYGAGG